MFLSSTSVRLFHSFIMLYTVVVMSFMRHFVWRHLTSLSFCANLAHYFFSKIFTGCNFVAMLMVDAILNTSPKFFALFIMLNCHFVTSPMDFNIIGSVTGYSLLHIVVRLPAAVCAYPAPTTTRRGGGAYRAAPAAAHSVRFFFEPLRLLLHALLDL